MSSAKKKILFCDNSLYELLNFRGEIINSYAADEHEVVLVAPQNVENFSLAPNVHYFPVKLKRSSMNPFTELYYYRSLLKIYRSSRPDYAFHYTIKPNIYGTLAAIKYGIPSVAVIAGLGYVFNHKGLGCFIARKLYGFALKRAEKVFVLNSSIYDLCLKLHLASAEKLVLLNGEGIDLEHFALKKDSSDHSAENNTPKNDFQAQSTKPTKFLMISRILYDKGYSEYVEAAKIVHQSHPEAQFQLLGRFDFQQPTAVQEFTVKEDHKSGYINYLGFVSDVRSIICEADCIVLPSYNEGMSRALLEALALSKPIITTDIPGCRETVEDGVNGFLVPSKDAAGLAQACLKFIDLPSEIRSQMGEKGREKAQKEFDIPKILAIYQSVTL